MTYYKVPNELDQKRIGNGWFFIAGELWTEKECKRHKIDTARLVPVQIPKSRIYWMFGARFSA